MSATTSPHNPDLPIQIGDVLAGKYRVEAVLGVGGMGIVVQARHLDLDEKVALKFLLPQAVQSKEATERFVREAKAAVRLRSEHVARVRDVGKLDNGAPYMVMEFLDGSDLSRAVQEKGALSIDESVAFVLQACEAIGEAHSLGIIHRDLKPQNLFVTRRVDGRPLVKVLDFGISKSIDAKSGLSLTRTSSIMGSPLYMSPEQMRSSKNVDQRSDIWGLGVILYELLTGRVPFEAEAIPELCLKVVQEPAEPPKSLRPEISEGLSAVVLKCLEKEPSRRFENVADLAAALEPYSESSKGSSERIAAVLNVPSRPPMVSISAISTASNPKIGTGGTAWGNTQKVEQRRKVVPLVAAGAAALALIAGVALAMAHGSSSKDGHAAASADSAAASSLPAPPPVATEAPKPVQTEPAPATATAAPTALAEPATSHKSATAKPLATAKPTSNPKPSAGAKPTAAPALTAPPRQFGE